MDGDQDDLRLDLTPDMQERLAQVWAKREKTNWCGEIQHIRYHSSDGRAPELPANRAGWQKVGGGYRRWSFPIHQ